MHRGRKISEDLRWAIVRMAPFIDIDRISVWTGVSRRQITRILSLHRKTGQVVTLQTELRGRPRELTVTDVQVCTALCFGLGLYLIQASFSTLGWMTNVTYISTSYEVGWRKFVGFRYLFQQSGGHCSEAGTL